MLPRWVFQIFFPFPDASLSVGSISTITKNQYQGFLYTSPWVRDPKTTRDFISKTLPATTEAQKSLITTTLYRPIFKNPAQFPYRTYLERATLIVSEVGFLCNGAYLARAFGGQIYNYLFNVPPAFHGDDIAYTFFDGTDGNVDANLALTFQEYLLNFVRKGDPNAKRLPRFEKYGSDEENWTLDVKSRASGGLKRTANPGANERCFGWQESF